MPKIFTDKELKEVWNLYRTGYKRIDICQMVDKSPEQVSNMWEIAQKRWGKGPRITTSPVSYPPGQNKFQRPPAQYSNPQYNKIY